MLQRSDYRSFIVLAMMCILALGSVAYGQKDGSRNSSSSDSAGSGKGISNLGPGPDREETIFGRRAIKPSWNPSPGQLDRPLPERPSQPKKARPVPSQSSPATTNSPRAEKKSAEPVQQKLPPNWGPDPAQPTNPAPASVIPLASSSTAPSAGNDGKMPVHEPPILSNDLPASAPDNVRAPFRLPPPPLAKKKIESTDTSGGQPTADRSVTPTHHPPVVLTTDAYGSAPSENVRAPFRLPPVPLQKKKGDPVKSTDTPSAAPDNVRAPFRLPPAPVQKKKSPDPVKSTDTPSPAPDNFRAPFRLPPAPVQKKKSPDPVKSTDAPSAAPDNVRAPFRLPPAPAAKKKG